MASGITLIRLGQALRIQGHNVPKALVGGLRKTAQFGITAVIKTIKGTKDPFRIRASGAYENPGNWMVTPLVDGAALSPTSEHSFFVERGRRPGHRPPYDRILEWVYQKRIVRRSRSLRNLHTGTPRTASIVRAIRWKIAKKGTKPRWPLRRTMPAIARHAKRESQRVLRRIAKKGGKGKP